MPKWAVALLGTKAAPENDCGGSCEYVCIIDRDKLVSVREKVTRCIDCKYCEETAVPTAWHDAEYKCFITNEYVYPDGFCYLGAK